MSQVDELERYLNHHFEPDELRQIEKINREELPLKLKASIDYDAEDQNRFQQLLHKFHHFRRIRMNVIEEILSFDGNKIGIEFEDDVLNTDEYEALLFGSSMEEEDRERENTGNTCPIFSEFELNSSRSGRKNSIHSLLRQFSKNFPPSGHLQEENNKGEQTIIEAPLTPNMKYSRNSSILPSPEPSTPTFDPLFS